MGGPVNRAKVAEAVELLDRALMSTVDVDRGDICDATHMLHLALRPGPWCAICGAHAEHHVHDRDYCLRCSPVADLLAGPA